MTFTKNTKFSKNGKKGAKIRWGRIEREICNNISSMNISTYTHLKSRLLGYLAGDGGAYIRKDKKGIMRYEILFCPDHESMISPFVEAFRLLYLKVPRIKNLGNYFRLRADSKTACIDLLKAGQLKTKKWRIPFRLFNDEKSKVEWLRAFFDCEAYVGKKEIRVQSVNKNGLMDVKKLLNEFRIESRAYEYNRKNEKWNTNYILHIGQMESRKAFFNKIGFNHQIKLQKLKTQFLDAKVA